MLYFVWIITSDKLLVQNMKIAKKILVNMYSPQKSFKLSKSLKITKILRRPYIANLFNKAKDVFQELKNELFGHPKGNFIDLYV
ncbi:MAG: hypothetical protein COB02_05075 [Candidatus Cloacimonadota bacterium]|nr:MAG: hypothetical protein COB02_05075 [Candidatus Cloacimonadota bacterium]